MRREWAGAAEFMVTVDGDSIRALAYPALVGSPRIGDRVLLNVGALEAGLGTGGYALVVAIPDRLPARRRYARTYREISVYAAAGDGGKRRRAGLPPP